MLERKFHRPEAGLSLGEGLALSGYASLFDREDQGGDLVQRGAYAASLARLVASGRRVKMLWQHDPTAPIGVWHEVREAADGLWVAGRLLPEVAQGREAAALLQAGAIDGLSIGYRTLRANRDGKGRRILQEIDLWEVSLVTFPMQSEARVAAKAEAALCQDLAALFRGASQALRGAP